MSRRRGEFEHRTSIFEGAFRAWSHLGGLEATEIVRKSIQDLDPLEYPLERDSRLNNIENKISEAKEAKKESGHRKPRRFFPYEPLPRSGLSHPFVQAILSPWLGPDAEQDAIQLGLTTLRTWWQHRRKGESGSALVALGTDRMCGVVEGYTRHFFNLAHCLVMTDGQQAPRTLDRKMKESEKVKNRESRKKDKEKEVEKLASLALNTGLAHSMGVVPAAMTGLLSVPGLEMSATEAFTAAQVKETEDEKKMTPLERLHAQQRRQLAIVEQLVERERVAMELKNTPPKTEVKKSYIPGKIDFPTLLNQVSTQSSQLAHRGAYKGPNSALKLSNHAADMKTNAVASSTPQYGDPTTTPVVFVSESGDIQFSMTLDGMVCSHCVKIVETVLKGSRGNKSPISGLLDATADQTLNAVLIKIDISSNAKRIAFEASRNLKMVGYDATTKAMPVYFGAQKGESKMGGDTELITTAFDVVAMTDPVDVFDWRIPCTCPDNGIMRDDCPRHSQMNKGIFQAFTRREKQVTDFVMECSNDKGQKACDGSNNCQCKGCKEKPMEPITITSTNSCITKYSADSSMGSNNFSEEGKKSSRSNSLSSGGNRRTMRMSITSETTFGRAMSGLSALSIDWENMEDFDVNVDHSSHINNDMPKVKPTPEEVDGITAGCGRLTGEACTCGPACVCEGCPEHDKPSEPDYSEKVQNNQTPQQMRMKKRSSIRRKGEPEHSMAVSFKVGS